jgi:cytochrome d ubiquinol oxidase subunit I
MVNAAYLAGTFVVIGVMGWYLWRQQHLAFARAGFAIAIAIAAVLAPLQLLAGDAHGLNSLRYQPIKVAAMEGDWESRARQPLILFAWPDMEEERNRYELAIPDWGSLILTHRTDGIVQGLKSVAPADRPNVPIVFFAFRLMVGIGLVLIAIAWTGVWLSIRGRLYQTRWFSFVCAFSSPLGFIAILSGWTVTEVGRQPWIVYGRLRTADAVAPVPAEAVASSLALFVLVYFLLLLAFFYFAARMVFAGPESGRSARSPSEVRPGSDSAPARGQAR